MTDRWTPSSWREKPAKQIPADYPDADALARVETELRRMPPLVFAGEARRLKALLGEVAAARLGACRVGPAFREGRVDGFEHRVETRREVARRGHPIDTEGCAGQPRVLACVGSEDRGREPGRRRPMA